MNFLSHLLARTLPRTLMLLAATGVGTIALMQWAPGYWSDVRELDLQTGSSVRQALDQQRSNHPGAFVAALEWIHSAVRGDLGTSRQFAIPVTALLAQRSSVSLHLLLAALVGGWSVACTLAISLALVNKRGVVAVCMIPAAWLLAIPVGALSTVCFVSGWGGPVLVMALLIGARELQFFQRLLNETLREPHFLYLRAAGVPARRILFVFALPQLLSQSLALLLRSVLTAIGLLIPVEVIFDLPGLGQLAWSATMNRDMPVLLSVTMIFACSLVLCGTIADFSMEPAKA
jgi:peptide/nickel transport system permease protein